MIDLNSAKAAVSSAFQPQTTSKQHLQQRIESFIAYFNATMAKPFRWTMKGKPLVA
jgi:hypothetical protein